MTDHLTQLWELAKKKDTKGLWRSNYWPIVQANYGAVENAWKKLCKGKTEEEQEDMFVKIKLALPEISKVRKGEQLAGSMPQPVILSRFLNEQRWIGCMDRPEIEVRDIKTCCQCSKPALKTGYCMDCQGKLPNSMSEHLKTHFISLGIRKTDNWRIPCMEYMMDKYPRLASLIGAKS